MPWQAAPSTHALLLASSLAESCLEELWHACMTCRNSVKVGSLDMSYRASTVEKAAPGLPKVLLVHGLGSSSFSWR